jgi:hypothetical protein
VFYRDSLLIWHHLGNIIVAPRYHGKKIISVVPVRNIFTSAAMPFSKL